MAAHKRDVALPDRLVWTISEFAAMCGARSDFIYDHLEQDPDRDDRAVIHLPLGVDVPAGRDPQARAWRVYRHIYEKAVADAAQGNRWTTTTEAAG